MCGARTHGGRPWRRLVASVGVVGPKFVQHSDLTGRRASAIVLREELTLGGPCLTIISGLGRPDGVADFASGASSSVNHSVVHQVSPRRVIDGRREIRAFDAIPVCSGALNKRPGYHFGLRLCSVVYSIPSSQTKIWGGFITGSSRCAGEHCAVFTLLSSLSTARTVQMFITTRNKTAHTESQLKRSLRSLRT